MGVPVKEGAEERSSRVVVGERLAGYIYGTIIVLSVIVVGAKAFPHEPGHVAALAFITAAVFWTAHVYAHALGHSVGHDERVSLAELKYIARREASMIEAALPPTGALLLGAIGVISSRASVWLALALGLVVLGAQGIAFARIERLGWAGTVGVVTANLFLGVVLIGLKIFVTH